MDRRGFLKSMLVMAGAACLGFLRPVLRQTPRWARVIVTDARGNVVHRTRWPIHVISGGRETLRGYSPFFPNPVWEKGAVPSSFFVNARLAGRLAIYLEKG